MQRVQHETAVGVLPAFTPTGTIGYYGDGDPALGVPPTHLIAGNLNQLQEEIANAITASGQTLSAGNLNQLSHAIPTLAPISFKNKVINGTGLIAQRATSGALTNAVTYMSLDRWGAYQNGTANGILARSLTVIPTSFQSSIKLGRNSGATTTGVIQTQQALESVNSIPLQGKTVTYSFYAKAGANFSAASNALSVFVYSGTGTDQANSAMGSWTGVSSIISTGQAITTTWTRYTFTGTVPSNCTQIGVGFYYGPVGTAGADDNVYITGVQLEEGSVATSYEQLPYPIQLALCQRYYFSLQDPAAMTIIANGHQNSTTQWDVCGQFPVMMRAAPTASWSNITSIQAKITGGANIGISTVTGTGTSKGTFRSYGTMPAAGATGYGLFLYTTSQSDGIAFSAEL